jgi:hypothetical protein
MSREKVPSIPTVCLGVTYTVANAYGCDKGRIGPTRCAAIAGARGDRWSRCQGCSTPPAGAGAAHSALAAASRPVYELLNFFIPTFKRFSKPIDTHLEKIQKATEREDELIKQLADIDIPILERTIKRIGYEIDFLEGRSARITGLFQKFAIIPAVVALYIAYSKRYPQ